MKYNAVIIHRTVGPEYDSRIRKMSKTLKKGNYRPIALFWDRRNAVSKGEYESGCPYLTMSLPLASKKKPRPGLIFSVLEVLQETIFGYYIIKKKCDGIVIITNHRLFLLLLLMKTVQQKKITKIVWDLRELPKGFMKKNSLRAMFFRYLLRLSDEVIVVNEARKQYMKDIYGCKIMEKAIVSPNYVTKEEAVIKKIDLPGEIKKWLSGRKYYYVQNPFNTGRYPRNTIEAILIASKKAIVLTGSVPKKVIQELMYRYPEEMKSRVYSTGMLPENMLKSVFHNAWASLIFYNNDNPNNDYCDPNRLFSLLSRGIPVVVGGNIGLKTVVEKYKCGVSLRSDGRVLEEIVKGVQELEAAWIHYKHNAMRCRTKLLWENNERIILNTLQRAN